jgi:hypothetical protein
MVPKGYAEVARVVENEFLHCLGCNHLGQPRASWHVADDATCLIIQAIGMASIRSGARESHDPVEWRHGCAVSYRRDLDGGVDGAGGGHDAEDDRERLLSLVRTDARDT